MLRKGEFGYNMKVLGIERNIKLARDAKEDLFGS